MIRVYRQDSTKGIRDLNVEFYCYRCNHKMSMVNPSGLAGFNESGQVYLCCEKDKKGQPCQRIITKEKKIQKWFPFTLLLRELNKSLMFDLLMEEDDMSWSHEDIFVLKDVKKEKLWKK